MHDLQRMTSPVRIPLCFGSEDGEYKREDECHERQTNDGKDASLTYVLTLARRLHQQHHTQRHTGI